MRIIRNETINMIDPSELLRPEISFAEKQVSKFRDYSIDETDLLKEQVRKTYRLMHLNQTVDFVKSRHAKWLKFNHFKGTIREALEKLNDLVDESDPDIDLPNIVHAFQTAEHARQEHPELDWLHLTGLIHDLGKIMAFYDEPQWAVVGDTFPVGCLWSDSIVYRDESFVGNPDEKNSMYNTKYGIYKPNCGITNLMMSWGHDEYLYQVLKHNQSTIPKEGLYMIRFHSFYPWHNGGDYKHFEQPEDEEIKKWVLLFKYFLYNHHPHMWRYEGSWPNKLCELYVIQSGPLFLVAPKHKLEMDCRYDLYTKSRNVPDIEKLWPYYQSLIDKYCPGDIEF